MKLLDFVFKSGSRTKAPVPEPEPRPEVTQEIPPLRLDLDASISDWKNFLQIQPKGFSSPIPRLGFGTAWFEAIDADQAGYLLRQAYDSGVRIIDTADVYGASECPDATGFSESCIGRVFSAAEKESLYLITKAGLVRSGDKRKTTFNNRPAHLRNACHESLQRLQMEAVPLFMLHCIDQAIPLEETLEVLNGLQREGKVRQLGLGVVNLETLKKAREVSDITAIQIMLDAWGEIDTPLLDYCRENHIVVTLAKPFGRKQFLDRPMMVGQQSVSSRVQKCKALLLHQMSLNPMIVPVPCTRDPHHLEHNLSILTPPKEGPNQRISALPYEGCPPDSELEFSTPEELAQLDLNRHGCALLKQVFSQELLEQLLVAAAEASAELQACIEAGTRPAHLVHFLDRPERGSYPLIHYPELRGPLVQMIRESIVPDLVKRAWKTDRLALGLGFSHMRTVDPDLENQRDYAPMHQDAQFLNSKTMNVCIGLTGYGGEHPGLDLFPGVNRPITDEELGALDHTPGKVWQPVAVRGDALIFDGYIPHCRSFTASSKPRINIEARLFPAPFVKGTYHPLAFF